MHAGAGAYICGEETALLDSLEGRRGQPRLKPPFPAVAGLYARPTVVNNVESIASRARRSSLNGAEWFTTWAPSSRPASASSACPGTSTAPASTRRRSASRCASCSTWPAASATGHRLKFWTPGRLLDADLHRRAPRRPAGLRVGGGRGLDARHPRAADLRRDDLGGARRARWTEFYAHESCGKCTPCREGTYWLRQIMQRLEARPGHPGRHRQAARHLRQHPRPLRSAPSVTAPPARSPRRSSTSARSSRPACTLRPASCSRRRSPRCSTVRAGAVCLHDRHDQHLAVATPSTGRQRAGPGDRRPGRPDHRRRRGQRAQGHPGHPGRRAGRHRDPAVLRPPAARPGRRLPPVPGRRRDAGRTAACGDAQAAGLLHHRRSARAWWSRPSTPRRWPTRPSTA